MAGVEARCLRFSPAEHLCGVARNKKHSTAANGARADWQTRVPCRGGIRTAPVLVPWPRARGRRGAAGSANVPNRHRPMKRGSAICLPPFSGVALRAVLKVPIEDIGAPSEGVPSGRSKRAGLLFPFPAAGWRQTRAFLFYVRPAFLLDENHAGRSRVRCSAGLGRKSCAAKRYGAKVD